MDKFMATANNKQKQTVKTPAPPTYEYQSKGGAVRSHTALPYHRVPAIALERLVKRYQLGVANYPDFADTTPNWQHDMDITEIYNHMVEHMERLRQGIDPDDDHLAAIAWAAFTMMWYEENKNISIADELLAGA